MECTWPYVYSHCMGLTLAADERPARGGAVHGSLGLNPDNATYKHYAESVKRFCRSIELCDDYLRGYYGLKRVR